MCKHITNLSRVVLLALWHATLTLAQSHRKGFGEAGSEPSPTSAGAVSFKPQRKDNAAYKRLGCKGEGVIVTTPCSQNLKHTWQIVAALNLGSACMHERSRHHWPDASLTVDHASSRCDGSPCHAASRVDSPQFLVFSMLP